LIMNNWLPFPLTPALSPRERENCRQTSGQTTIPVIGWPTVPGQGEDTVAARFHAVPSFR
jgi:hypothetical protein